MKYTIHLLVVLSLAAGSLGCSRYQVVPSASVAANTGEISRDRVTESRTSGLVSDSTRPAVQTQRRVVTPTRAVQAVPARTRISVTMLDAVSTDKSKEGEAFTANLTDPIIVNGRVVAERAATVQGLVYNIERPGRVKGRAQLQLKLTQITTGGRTYRLYTEPFTAIAEDNKARDAGLIAGGAGAGAIIGAVTGGKKGAAIGAAIGGGSGTAAVLLTRGQDLRLAPETRVNFVLSNSVTLPVLRRIAS